MIEDPKPPQNIDAEQAFIGCLLLDPDCRDEALTILQVSERAFYRKDHILIYNALVRMHSDGQAIDIVTLEDHLTATGDLADVGGRDYLLDLARSVPSAANVRHYAKIVRDKAAQRELIRLGDRLTSKGYRAECDPEKLLTEAENELLRMRGEVTRSGSRTAEAITRDLVKKILGGKSEPGLPTGFDLLDARLGGLRPGQYMTLAARPAVGKTAMAVQIACHVAMVSKVPVAFFSLEMGGEALCRRIIAQQLGIYGGKLQHPDRLTAMNKADLESYRGPDNLHIVECPGMTGSEMRSEARRLKIRPGIGLIVIDYLGLMTDPQGSKQNKVVEISNLSRAVKNMAREIEVPVLCLHAMSRSSQHENRAPMLHDLRDSSAVEHDSDVVMFLHPRTKIRADQEIPIVVEILCLIRKNREGDLGNIAFQFNRPLTRFSEQGGAKKTLLDGGEENLQDEA